VGFIEILIFVAVVISMMTKAASAAAKRPPTPTSGDIDQAERTRRIQEEIRRKIAERRGGLTQPAEMDAPAEEATPPVFGRPVVQPLDPFGGPRDRRPRAFEPRAPKPPPLPAGPSAEQVRQEELTAQLAALREAQATARTTALARADETNWTESTRTASGPSAWRSDLRSPADLRRAIVLRELLGPPVALR
jgi:hypothetical protein